MAEDRSGVEFVIAIDPRSTEPAIWSCKIGAAPRGLLPRGSDAPMRRAIERAYEEVLGFPADYTFSGWGAALDEGQLAFIERRPQDVERLEAQVLESVRNLPSSSALRKHIESTGWLS